MRKRNIPTLSIKIMEAEEIRFYLKNKYSANDSSFEGEYVAAIEDKQIVIRNEKQYHTKSDEIVFAPQYFTQCFFELKDVTIGVDFHWQQKENQRFNGVLKLLVDNGKILAINVLNAESYMKCVISSEMRGDSSFELLKAHAVVSRSWLFAQIEKQKEVRKEKYQSVVENEDEYIRWYDREDHVLFDVCADDHCQRYQGITKSANTNVEKAIDATKGQVLRYKGKTCDTRYSKSCGGHTESFENVWEPMEHPYLKKIVDNDSKPKGYDLDLSNEENAENWITGNPEAYCNTHDNEILSQVLNDYDQTSTDFYRWEVVYKQQELAELIRSKSGIDFGEIIDLEPVERGASGRLIKLKIIGTKKILTIGKELEIRRWLSPSHLYSSAFIVEKEDVENGIPAKFILKGAGWGHGVGLCQIGAAVMGHKGHTYKDILNHYFGGAELVELY